MRITILCCVALVGLVAFWVSRPTSLEDHAIRLGEQFASGDSRAIYPMAHPREVQACELTAEKFDRVFEAVVAPELARFDFQGISSSTQYDSFQGHAVGQFVGRSGFIEVVDFTVDATEDGPKTRVLSFLATAWILREAARLGRNLEGDEWIQAVRKGITSDRGRLDEIGLHGTLPDLDGEFRSWDQALSRIDRILADRETKPRL